MNFALSETQEHLRASVREYLQREMPVSYARAMMDDPSGFTAASWQSLAELGWLGLAAPSELGGSDLGTLEIALVLEQAGAVVAPGPFYSTVCLGLASVLSVADDAQKRALVPPVIEGKRRITLALAEARGTWDASGIETAASAASGDEYSIAGTKLFVPDARSASTIVVVARVDDALGFFCVPAGARGVRVEPMITVDASRKLDVVVLDGVRVGRDALLGTAAVDASVLDAIVDRAKTALAAEMCGAASACLDMSVEYAKIRKQFDRPIGTFQAIQHKLADMKVAVENTRSLVYYAAWALDTGANDAALAAAMAKAYASDACTRVVADAIQAHGGVGFTWEHDLHLYYKRVKADEVTYGDATANREIVARLLGL